MAPTAVLSSRENVTSIDSSFASDACNEVSSGVDFCFRNFRGELVIDVQQLHPTHFQLSVIFEFHIHSRWKLSLPKEETRLTCYPPRASGPPFTCNRGKPCSPLCRDGGSVNDAMQNSERRPVHLFQIKEKSETWGVVLSGTPPLCLVD